MQNETSSPIENGQVDELVTEEKEKEGVSFYKKLGILALVQGVLLLVFVLWFIHRDYNNSIISFLRDIIRNGISILGKVAQVYFGNKISWILTICFIIVQLIILKFLPGIKVYGPPDKNNYRPEYKKNGLAAFILTIAVYLGSAYGLNLFSPSIIYNNFGYFLGTFNIIAVTLCSFLYLKGKTFPSKGEHGTTGSAILDYYWGMELYPRIFDIDIKQFTNCRFGMTLWAILILVHLHKHYELNGVLSNSIIVSGLLQLVYIIKFFTWETGYFNTIDIMHDRAGFYICWGCLVFLPIIYTLPTLYLVKAEYNLSYNKAILVFTIGLYAIYMNYSIDLQRQEFRNNKLKSMPYINANYIDEEGNYKQNKLLLGGYWGMARHINYTFELLAALMWTVPAGYSHLYPYIYVIYLTILLLHRIKRVEDRCEQKYKKDWDEYKAIVPYNMITRVY